MNINLTIIVKKLTKKMNFNFLKKEKVTTALITDKEATFYKMLYKLDKIVIILIISAVFVSFIKGNLTANKIESNPLETTAKTTNDSSYVVKMGEVSDGVREVWNVAEEENKKLNKDIISLKKQIVSLKTNKTSTVTIKSLDVKSEIYKDLDVIIKIKNSPANQKQLDYITKYAKQAQMESRLSGIKASVTLAQGIFESSSGQSRLATEGNNHFGIKCFTKHDHKKNGCIPLCDDCKELGVSTFWFKPYSSAAKSFSDHSKKLTSENSRYKFVFNNPKNSYVEQAYALEALGYATNKQYAESIIGLIEKYKLYQYD